MNEHGNESNDSPVPPTSYGSVEPPESDVKPRPGDTREEVVAAFEQDWTEGQASQIESFLPPDLDEGQKSSLLKALLLSDLAKRLESGLPAERETYSGLADKHSSDVQSALEEFERGQTPDTYVPTPNNNQDSTQRSSNKQSVAQVGPAPDGRRYHILAHHANGGLGIVYRAHDSELKREVALKEIQGASATDPQAQDRFIFEAEVTGALQHPGIIPVYGLGRYADKRPYYAMRFVRGKQFQEAISAFHSKKGSAVQADYFRPEFKTLLRHILDVCRAIHYAHGHQILHRDIKPGNIMIGDYGETFLLDWGLAKVLDSSTHRELSTKSVEIEPNRWHQTQAGRVLGTPPYMSPEQAAGKNDQMTIASDIYSLGATLFVVLTGREPVEGASTEEIVENVRQGKVLEVATIAPLVPPPLRSICRKAMQSRPEDRYDSAKQLGEDLERWLDDELVLAHAPSEGTFERFARLLRRYHTWTIPTAASLILLVVVLAASTLYVNRARQQQQLATENAVEHFRQALTTIDKWLVGTDDALQFFPAMEGVRRDLLLQAEADYQKLADDAENDQLPELILGRARAIARIGMIHRSLNELDAAKESFQSALKIVREASEIAEINRLDLILEEANNLARLAALARDQRQSEQAERFFRQAEDLLLSAIDPEQAAAIGFAEILQLHGEMLLGLRKPVEAEALLRKAEEYFRQVQSEPSAELTLAISKNDHLMGRVMMQRGNDKDAERYLDRAASAQQSVVRQHADRPDYIQTLADTQSTQANLLHSQGRVQGWRDVAAQSIARYLEIVEAKPGIPQYEERLAKALANLGITELEQGRSDLASRPLSQSLQIYDKLLALDTNFLADAAAVWDALGQVHMQLFNGGGDASILLEETVRQYTESTGNIQDAVFRCAIARVHYATFLGMLAEGKEDQAIAQFEEALLVLSSQLDTSENTPEAVTALARARVAYGEFLFSLGKASQEQSARQYATAFREWRSCEDALSSNQLHNMLLAILECPFEAQQDLEWMRATASQLAIEVPENPRYQNTLAQVFVLRGEYDEAETALARVKTIRGVWIGSDHFVLARLKALQGDIAAAQQALADGEQWRVSNQPYSRELAWLQGEAVRAIEQSQVN